MFPLSMWILSLFSIKSSWQKRDCKNSIESVDRLINFTLSSNSLFWAPSKNSSCFGTSSLSVLDKISVSSGIGDSFMFCLLDQDTHHHFYPLPGKSFESYSDKWISYLSRSCFSFFGTISIILFALSIRFVIGWSKSVFRASTLGVCGGKKVSS